MGSFEGDRLQTIFNLRKQFLENLRESIPESQPDVPVEISTKQGQQHCRDLALRGVEEMFEALQHLKNWKTHKLPKFQTLTEPSFLRKLLTLSITFLPY
jgi:hypothetical protein